MLGNILIGDNARIGAGSVVLRDVPTDFTVVGVPGRMVHPSGEKVNPLEHGKLPDSEGKVIRLLLERIELLEQQVKTLQKQQSEQDWEGDYRSCSETDREPVLCRLGDREIEEFLGGTL